jgi:hypothetical protein
MTTYRHGGEFEVTVQEIEPGPTVNPENPAQIL